MSEAVDPQAASCSRQASLDLVLLSKPWPEWLRQVGAAVCFVGRQEMRSNWAGETGAVAIYRGCLCVRVPGERGEQLRRFATEHVAARHGDRSRKEVVAIHAYI